MQSIHGWKVRASDSYSPPKKQFWNLLFGRLLDFEAYRTPQRRVSEIQLTDKPELPPVTNITWTRLPGQDSALLRHTFEQDGMLYEVRPVQELNAASEPVELPHVQPAPAEMATRNDRIDASRQREEV